MIRPALVACVFALLAVPANAADLRSDEGCEAQNPLQPTCSFTVTHTSTTPVTGVGGVGDWLVTVKRGSQVLKWESLPDGRPTIYEISFKVGDKVKARAIGPGASLTVGHVDP